jgi:hypothetical protein
MLEDAVGRGHRSRVVGDTEAVLAVVHTEAERTTSSKHGAG